MLYEISHLVVYFIFLAGLLTVLLCYSLYNLRVFLGLKVEDTTHDIKDIVLITSVSFLFLLIGRILYTFFDFSVNFKIQSNDLYSLIFWKTCATFQMVGYGLFFLIMERRIMNGRDKYIPVIAFFTITLIAMLMNSLDLIQLLIIVAMISTAFLPISYLNIALKSEGIIRKKALFIFTGFLLIFLGSTLVGESFIDPLREVLGGLERIQIHPISFGMKIIGYSLFFFGFKK